jgi:hypothetical protein
MQLLCSKWYQNCLLIYYRVSKRMKGESLDHEINQRNLASEHEANVQPIRPPTKARKTVGEERKASEWQHGLHGGVKLFLFINTRTAFRFLFVVTM